MQKFISKPINYIYIYTRVSTGKQSTDKKFGLLSQTDLCNKYINNFYSDNKNILKYSDVGSSYKSHKILTGMKDMIFKLKPNSLILISETSRLGRSKKMVETILKIVKNKRSFIVSISENLIYGKTKLNDNIFIRRVMESERESDALSLRMKNIQAYIKRNGGHIGKAPFGYTINRDYRNIPVLKEKLQDFKLIDEIVNLANESLSYIEIKEKMNEKKLLHNDKLWTTIKIKNILNKFYPEHLLLDIKDNKQNNITIVENQQGETQQVNPQNNIYNRTKDSVYGQLKITISNKSRNIQYSPIPSNSIKLRSGKEINSFQ